MKSKKCPKCKINKFLTEFHTRKISSDGLTSQCKECRREYARSYYRKNPGKIKEINQRSDKKNPERKKKSNRRYQERNRFHTALKTSYAAAKRGDYAPCSATVEEIKVAFTGHCAICNVLEKNCKIRLNMDHLHTGNGHFRGWLCQKCNAILGFSGDDEKLLIVAATYLRETS